MRLEGGEGRRRDRVSSGSEDVGTGGGTVRNLSFDLWAYQGQNVMLYKDHK